ncbi:MAG: T9SS type A sorting domain-containing protein [Crocinitomicaceae bacterium]|nr:T9SS type A sorting domain-containing protein [Crocinitomicaceae bacterium]MBP6031946.1 T9SS type A sorting domain-containing protein [Crocinitomicaceae bacterium]
MKKLYIKSFGIIALFLANVLSIQAQVSGFAITGLTTPTSMPTTICGLTANVTYSALTPSTSSAGTATIPYVITGNNFSGFQFVSQVNWGDGVTTTSNGGTSTSGTNIAMAPAITHTYATPGTYSIHTTVYNQSNQTYALDSVMLTVGSCTAYFYCMIQVDCNNDGTIDSQINAPVPVTLSNGTTTYTDTLQNNMFMMNNVWAGNYSLSIDPSWLAANNYVIGNIIPSPTVTVGSGTTTTLITLNCAAQTTLLCATGQVYCDSNDNGMMDSGETPIANAPISVNGTVVYSNANGIYNISYPGIINDTVLLSMNANWLTQHGYAILNNNGSNLNYITGTPCNSGLPINTINFPLLCGGTVTPTMCYSGFVFCDSNGNGVMNPNEAPLAGAPVILYNNSSTNSSVTVYTDSTGYFTYCGQYSTSTYVFATISQSWLTYNGYNPTVGVITLVGSPAGTSNIGYIAINCGGTTTTCVDLWTTVTPWIGYYQNTTAYVKINWGNYGPGAAGNYTMTMSFPAGVTVNAASIANGGTVSGNTISWNLNSASSFFSNYDVITFNVPGGLLSGTAHYFTSTITPTSGTDCSTVNNAGSLLQLVGNSYDPNDKVVARPDAAIQFFGDETQFIDAMTQEALTYTIRFQNTGTAPAQNIYIIDTLDADLDWSSFTMIQASHNMQVVNLGNGIMRFEFPNIWLADSTTNEPASHGHLVYRIMENAANHYGTEIENTAYIYFDWNDPIITNTTYNFNNWIEGLSEGSAQNIHVYPNPASESLTISCEGDFDYQLVDLSGRIVSSGSATDSESITISNAAVGIYQLNVQSNQGNSSLKVVKQ